MTTTPIPPGLEPAAARPPGAATPTPILWLACGMLSALLYAAMLVFIPRGFPGYSSAAQAVSELSAVGAPTRPLWVALGLVWTALYIAFGWGVWRAARDRRALRVAGALLIAQGVIGIYFPPMHLRGMAPTLTDVLHIVWSGMVLLCMACAIALSAAALRGAFRRYSVATLAVFVVFGVLTGIDGPRVAANLPTPLIGVWERINLAAWLLWVMVLAVTLMRRPAPAGGVARGA